MCSSLGVSRKRTEALPPTTRRTPISPPRTGNHQAGPAGTASGRTTPGMNAGLETDIWQSRPVGDANRRSGLYPRLFRFECPSIERAPNRSTLDDADHKCDAGRGNAPLAYRVDDKEFDIGEVTRVCHAGQRNRKG